MAPVNANPLIIIVVFWGGQSKLMERGKPKEYTGKFTGQPVTKFSHVFLRELNV